MYHSKLQELRLSKSLSQSQLATAAGLSVRVLQSYEQGRRDLSGAKLATLLRICITLNCGLANILQDGETTELLKQYNEL